jgi:uncharacterized coiled-coil protein SlyX
MSDGLDERITKLETGLSHLQRLFEQLDEVVTAQSLENQRMERRISQLQEQLKQLKEKPDTGGDPLDEKPPHY